MEEEVRGKGAQKAVGELITCPFCIDMWVATGLVAGRHAIELATGEELRPFPRQTAIGSLCAYVAGANSRNYQPANITFDLLPPLDDETGRRLRHDLWNSQQMSLRYELFVRDQPRTRRIAMESELRRCFSTVISPQYTSTIPHHSDSVL